MADSPTNAYISGIDHKVISELATALSESNARVYQQLGDIAKMSRGPGGLGGTSGVTEEAKAKAQQNIRGFSGGGFGAAVSGMIKGYNGVTDSGGSEAIARHRTEQGQFKEGQVTDAQRLAVERTARGLTPYSGGGVVDPGLYGGHFTAGAALRTAANMANTRAGQIPYGSSQLRMLDAASALQKAGNAMPVVGGVFRAGQNVYRAGQGLTALGSAQGTSGAGADLTIPGTNIGFRSPFNPAAIRGAQTKLDQIKLASRAGVNYAQAGDINSAMLAQGYNQGSVRAGRMRDMYGSVVANNQALNNPNTYAFGDAATRFKSADALGEVRDVLNQLGPAANNAHYSLQRVQQSMSSYVSSSVQRGGSALTAGKAFTNQLQATGMDPATLQGLEGNPYVQAEFIREGVKPWQIGGASGAQKTQAEYTSLKTQYENMGGRGVDPKDPKGQEILQKMKYFLGIDIPLDQLTVMLSKGGQKAIGRSKALENLDQYTGAGGAKSGHQLADLRGDERQNILRSIETTAGLSGKQMTDLEKSLQGGKAGATGNKWSGDWESKVRKALGTDILGDTESGRAAKGGGGDQKALLQQAADALSKAAGLSTSAKDLANAGGPPTNSKAGY